MIDPRDAHDIINASLCFNELYKRTIATGKLPEVATKTQIGLLVTLAFNGPMNMTELSKRMGIAPEQTTRAIRSLRDAGLVESARNTENQRMVVARLSQKGEDAMADHERELFGNLESCLKGLDSEERRQLAALARQATGLMAKAGLGGPIKG